MYTELHFKGYKSFLDNHVTSLLGIKHCNVIIGKNNSGKSSLLDVIATSVDESYFKKYGRTIQGLEAVFIIDKSDLAVFNQYSCVDGIYEPYEFAQKYIGQPYRVSIEQITSSQKQLSMTEKGNDVFASSPLNNHWKEIAFDLSRREDDTIFRRISAERNISPERERQEELLSEDGSGASYLIRKFINYSRYDEALIENDLLNGLNTIMRPEIEFEEIKIQQINQNNEMLWEVFLREKGYNRYALSQSGSGLKTIVLVLLNLLIIPHTMGYSGKTIIYGFEELENNLHPSLQRRLFDYIYSFAIENNVYIFLTTHSHIAINAFFGKEKANIYHVVKDSNGSVVKKIDNYIDKVEILDDLDVKASDLLQSNGIIWVEGPSDRVYVKHWLKVFCDNKYVEGTDYQFMYYGGRLLSHYSVEQTEDLINILITNRNAAIIMDSDKRYKQDSVNDTKKRIIQEFTEHKMFAWLTKGKEIENYIPVNAIMETFQCDKLEECGQYELFPAFIEKTCPNFVSQKVSFAQRVIKNITADNSKNRLDLKLQVEKLYAQIQKWNS